MQIEQYMVSENTTIIDTMKIIDQGARAIAFVCEGLELLAVVSDGDIRRYIIGNGDLKKPISHIANYSPLYKYESELCNYKQFMQDMGISAVPILDDSHRIVRIEFLNAEFRENHEEINIPIIIMAGGKGTRLQPYTQILPKPLIPIGDKTITEHIMERFEEYSCYHFDMIVNYQKNFIKSYFMDNENKHDITFVEEPEFWGTAGGLKLIESKYQETVFVTNCDILIDANYADILKFHKEQKNIITMVCAMKKMVVPYGTVELAEDGNVLSLREKPEFDFITNTGLYLIEPEFLARIPENTFVHITDVIQSCIDEGCKVGVFPIDEDAWMDMGQLGELEKMKKRMENS